MGRPAIPLWTRVTPSQSCLLWNGKLRTDGYARTWWGGKQYYVHRLFYELSVGPIPEGLHLDHLCRVRNCVNPQHLEPVTREENHRRGVNGKGKLRVSCCPRGHEYTPENTYIPPNSPTARHCRECAKKKPGGSQYRQAARERARLTLEG